MTDPRTNQDLLTEWQQAVDQGLKAWQAVSVPQAAAAMQIFQQAVGQGLAAWSHLAQQDQGPSATLGNWKQSMDQAVEILARSLADTMASEQVAALMGQALQQYLNAVGPARKHLQTISEDMLRTCNLPSRTQVTRLASSLVGLDERVESVDDRLESLQEQLQAMATQLAALQAQISDQRSRAPVEHTPENPEAPPPAGADQAQRPHGTRRPPKKEQA